VPRTVFHPPPEVDSALIRLRRLPRPRISSPPEAFEAVLRVLFGARRKTIRRALMALVPREEVDALLRELGLDPQLRGEVLDIPQLDRLARALRAREVV